MGDEIKQVPGGVWLTCKHGASPSPLVVTNNSGTALYSDNFATEADLVPGVNIFPFGICKLTGGPCVPAPINWDKVVSGMSIGGSRFIIKDAKLVCGAMPAEGSVEIHFSLTGALAAADSYSKGGDGSFELPNGGLLGGAGLGLAHGVGDGLGPLAANTNSILHVGDLNFSQKSVSSVVTGLDGNKVNIGTLMDGVSQNYGNSIYTLSDAAQVVRMPDGSLTTLDHRRLVSSIEGGARTIPANVVDASTPLPDGQAGRYSLNRSAANRLGVDRATLPSNYGEAVNFRSANQGASFPPNGSSNVPEIKTSQGPVVRNHAPSSAHSAITNISQSVQANRHVANANNFLIRNADTVATAGKVTGRVTVVAGLAVDGYNIYSGYQQDGGEIGEHTVDAATEAAFAWGGAAAGAKGGALAGAAIGGPVGAVVGGVIGGIAGGLVGGAVGDKVGDFFGSFWGD